MRPVVRFNRGQRIVAVVGLGVALWFVGEYVTSLGNPLGVIAYAPLSKAVGPLGYSLTTLERLLVWLGLVIAWVSGSGLLLRDSKRSQPPADE
jgi:hypothetical protein